MHEGPFMKPSTCLLIVAVLMVGCHDPAFDAPTYSEQELQQAQSDGYAEGMYTLCAVLIDTDYLRYLAEENKPIPAAAFQKYPSDIAGQYVGKTVGNLCRRAARLYSPAGPT
jgi:hypothetical protein